MIAIDVFQNNVISTTDGSNFNIVTSLPYISFGHCLVIVDENTFFVTGFPYIPNQAAAVTYTKSRRIVYQNEDKMNGRAGAKNTGFFSRRVVY